MHATVAGVHADVDEADEAAVAHHAERGVVGAHQGPGTLHDPLDEVVELQTRRDVVRRVEQPTEPTLGELHLGGAGDELVEQLVELESGHRGEGEPLRGDRGVGVLEHCPPSLGRHRAWRVDPSWTAGGRSQAQAGARRGVRSPAPRPGPPARRWP